MHKLIGTLREAAELATKEGLDIRLSGDELEIFEPKTRQRNSVILRDGYIINGGKPHVRVATYNGKPSGRFAKSIRVLIGTE